MCDTVITNHAELLDAFERLTRLIVRSENKHSLYTFSNEIKELKSSISDFLSEQALAPTPKSTNL